MDILIEISIKSMAKKQGRPVKHRDEIHRLLEVSINQLFIYRFIERSINEYDR